MGCYGIGISRLAGVIAEAMMDDRGLVWPENVAPYTHVVVAIGDTMDKAKQISSMLESQGFDVILDDRDASFGAKAADADLLGIPNRIVVSEKTLAQGGYEWKKRTETATVIIPI